MKLSSIPQQLSFEIPDQPFTHDTYGLVPTKIRTRLCTVCRGEFPRSEFRKFVNGRFTLNSHCKRCHIGYTRNWQVKNETRYRQGYKERYSSDPESQIIRGVNLRAKKLGAKGQLTVHAWREVKELYGNRCVYCGISSLPLQIDHLWPLSLANKNMEVSEFATNDTENILPSCALCNSAKSDHPFIIMLGWKNGLLS